MKRKVLFHDLGKISYSDALEYQLLHHNKLVKRKLEIRKGSNAYDDIEVVHDLLFCEHKPVYTLGKSGSISNLLLSENQLQSDNIEFFKTNRGGDITYHGPGQLVGYPILDLDYFFNDVHKYVRYIEEVIIQTLLEFDIIGCRIKGLTGVWIEGKNGANDRKICAIGIHMSRWVTLHGFALNVNTDLDYFKGIIPCGIDDKDKDVTSMAKELRKEIDIEGLKRIVKSKFAEIFGVEYV